MLVDSHNWIDITLRIWFSLTAVSVIYVAWDLITRTPEMKVMKWGWVFGSAVPLGYPGGKIRQLNPGSPGNWQPTGLRRI